MSAMAVTGAPSRSSSTRVPKASEGCRKTTGLPCAPILGLPYSYIDASIPVCCSFMFMYYGRMFWNSLRGKGNTTELDVQEESQQ